jgi:membrane fusion protein (multidrug efflux system)
MSNTPIRRTVLAALLFPFVAPLSGCKEKEQAAPPKPPDVEVVTIEQTNVPIYREWVGTLEGEVNATISAQVSGYLVSRNYKEGSVVTSNQVLFQIEQAPFKATLDQAKADVGRAQAQKEKYALDVKRLTPLAATQAISQQELDDAIQNEKSAQAQVEATKAAVESAALNLGFTTIRSPVAGVAGLASAQAQIGNLVGPSSGPLTTVTTIDPIRAYFSVSQQLMTQMQERRLFEGKGSMREMGEGPPIELILASGQIYPQKGRVRFANNQVDVKTGTLTVVGELPNPNMLLAPGMFVRVRGLLDTQTNALVVPQRVVTDMQGRSLIAVVGADNKVSIRPITPGERIGSDWVISGNVKAGDRVVAEGIQKVRDGAVVNPIPFSEKPIEALATTPEVPAKAEEKKP